MPTTTHLTAVTDLNRGVSMQLLKAALLSGDKQAHRFTVQCTRNGLEVSLAGASVTGYFIRTDGATVVISGSVENGAAVVVLPAACYAVPGRFSLVIKVAIGDVVETIYWAEGTVSRSQTDAQVDPGKTVPSLSELLARIDEMETATTQARQAAQTALDAAIAADASVTWAVVPTAEGHRIMHIHDASSKPLQGLLVYGRTTQPNAPTPSASVMPESPGNSGRVEVATTGKNLFDKDGVTFGKGLLSSSGDVDASLTSYVHTETYIPVKPDTGYVLSGSIVTESSYNTVAFYDAEKQFISRYSAGAPGLNAQFTTPANCWYIRFNAASAYDPDTIQLEVGSIVTAYEAFTTQQASMLTGALRGVQVPSGGNYVDASGQMWLADCIDGSAGQRVTNIPVVSYNGSNYAPAVANAAGTAFRLTLPHPGFAFDASADQTGMVFSNRLPTLSQERVLAGEQGIAISGTHAIVCVSGIATTNALVAWLAAEPLTVIYRPAHPLNTPTAMTTAEALSWKALRSHKHCTTFYNSADAWMAADYVADLKTYIDSRLAAIASAVL